MTESSRSKTLEVIGKALAVAESVSYLKYRDLFDEQAGDILTALQASGMAVVARTAWKPHVSFDVDGGFGLEWDGPGRSLYLVEVRGDADVVWIVRQDGKLLHGDEHKVGAGDGKADRPEGSAEAQSAVENSKPVVKEKDDE